MYADVCERERWREQESEVHLARREKRKRREEEKGNIAALLNVGDPTSECKQDLLTLFTPTQRM